MSSEIQCYSISYKEHPYVLPTGWIQPFEVGDPKRPLPDSRLRDTGDGASINELNPYFGELTAHYWIWKNMPKVEYIGFCHYRRYFNFLFHQDINQNSLYAEPSPEILQFLNQNVQRDLALSILQQFDIISTRSCVLPFSIREQFCVSHPPYIWDIFLETIKERSPKWLSRYLPYFDLSREFRFYPVFITRWEIFDEFCSLLFDILFPIFKRIGKLEDIPGQRFQPGRYPAYLSERFFMLYLHARSLRAYGAQIFALERDC